MHSASHSLARGLQCSSGPINTQHPLRHTVPNCPSITHRWHSLFKLLVKNWQQLVALHYR
jgi:hypothetical protein